MEILSITERLSGIEAASVELILPYEKRQKSRMRVTLSNGQEAGLDLPRGKTLRHGDCLRARDGSIIKIIAEPEPLSIAYAKNPLDLMRACYHLGNRHVAVQIHRDWIRYLQDHVLDQMLISLGLNPVHEQLPFEPEDGAYHQHAHHSHEPTT